MTSNKKLERKFDLEEYLKFETSVKFKWLRYSLIKQLVGPKEYKCILCGLTASKIDLKMRLI